MAARPIGTTAASLARLLAQNPAEVALANGTTTIIGSPTASGILWNNAGLLAVGPALTDAVGNLTAYSADAGATVGPLSELFRDSASPAANDVLGGVSFTGRSSTGVKRTYGLMQWEARTATNGAEDGTARFYTMSSGALTEFLNVANLTASFGGGINAGAGNNLAFTGRSSISSTADGNIRFRNNAGTAVNNLTLSSSVLTFDTALATAAPSGGTAGSWKFGIRVAAVSALDTTQYIQLDIGGTAYKLALIS